MSAPLAKRRQADRAADGQPFVKMHELGNDFVILDARQAPVSLPAPAVRAIADRRTGVGFDEMLVIGPAKDRLADAFMGIRNADGSEAEACGNAARCVAWLLMRESGARAHHAGNRRRIARATVGRTGGSPSTWGRRALDWRDIPLREPLDTLHLARRPRGRWPTRWRCRWAIRMPCSSLPMSTAIDLAALGPMLEQHPLFPQRANIEVAQVLAPRSHPHAGVGTRRRDHAGLRQRRLRHPGGGGPARTQRTGEAEVMLDGGPLSIAWRADEHVFMTGPVAFSYAGTSTSLLRLAAMSARLDDGRGRHLRLPTEHLRSRR